MARARTDAPGDPPDDAPDDAPTGAVLSRTTRMTLRRVLHAYREGWLREERLAAAARMAAENARRHGLAAARMLVAIKAEWAALEAVRRLALRDARALLDRLVTPSIDASYASCTPYRTTPGPRRGGDDVWSAT